MPRALVSSRDVARFEDRYRDVLHAAGFEIVYPPPGEANELKDNELRACLDGIDAVIAGSERYTVAVFAACPGLRVIARVGVGYDAIDLAAATANGVAVTIAPNTNQGSVAEHTFALMLALTRHIPGTARRGRAWWLAAGDEPTHARPYAGARRPGPYWQGRRRTCSRLRHAARRLRPGAGPRVLRRQRHHARTVRPPARRSRFPLPPLAAHRRDARADQPRNLARMKPTAMLINTSRGGLIKESDLVEALREKRLAGAGLDVFEQEPPAAGNPLFGLDNVVLTPHAAGVDMLSLGDMARSAAEAVVALLPRRMACREGGKPSRSFEFCRANRTRSIWRMIQIGSRLSRPRAGITLTNSPVPITPDRNCTGSGSDLFEEFMSKIVSKSAADSASSLSVPLVEAEKVLGVAIATARERHQRLTPRERQVAKMMATGQPNREIAEELGISVKTLDIHRANLVHKLHARTTADVANLINLLRLTEVAEAFAG